MKEKEGELINKMTEIYTVSREKYQLSIPSFGKTKLPRRSLQFTLEERFLGLRASFIVVSTQIGGQQLLMKARLASIFDCYTNREGEREKEERARKRKRERKREHERDAHTRRICGCLVFCVFASSSKKQTEPPLFTRPSKRFRLRVLRIPVLYRFVHSARLSHMLLHLLYFDL